ncbi:hypothetical protein BSKO_09296 [Bryopsis sp. KO-2023]|nr:hypothetical protein BSKO_09296 [Bryopsis sp. KO-2023]
MSEKKMLVGYKGVKYGLQSRPAATQQKKSRSALAAFGGDSSSDEEDVATQVARHQAKNLKDGKVAAEHAAALAEDPSVYDYDGVYNEMHAAREEPKKVEKIVKKPKYIAALLETAARRNKEQDVVYDRRMIKDRKKEDHLFGDKEVFVTSAYKKKLQEEKLWLEEQKRKEALEEKSDVTKRKDLREFYQNLYCSNHGFGEDRSSAVESPTNSPVRPKVEEEEVAPGFPDEVKKEVEDMEADVQLPTTDFLSEYDRLRMGAEEKRAAVHSGDPGDGGNSGVPVGSDAGEGSDATQTKEPALPTSEAATEPVQKPTQRRNAEDVVAAARARYLARKKKGPG